MNERTHERTRASSKSADADELMPQTGALNTVALDDAVGKHFATRQVISERDASGIDP
jgi:hypothetical protein